MQTVATSHNIVSPTILGDVGTCCVVHANEHNNCQRSSKEAMHDSGTVILKKIAMRVRRRFYEANNIVVPYRRNMLGPKMFNSSVKCCWPTMSHPFACDLVRHTVIKIAANNAAIIITESKIEF